MLPETRGLTGCDTEVLTVVSLNWAVKPGSHGCPGHTVPIPGSAGADTGVGGSQKNPLIWEGLESAQGQKRKELWVQGGGWSLGGHPREVQAAPLHRPSWLAIPCHCHACSGDMRGEGVDFFQKHVQKRCPPGLVSLRPSRTLTSTLRTAARIVFQKCK